MVILIKKRVMPFGLILFVLLFWVFSPEKALASDDLAKTPSITADHRKFEVLKKDFTSGPEVTKACLTCHTEAAKQVHADIHWTWKWGGDGQPEGGKRVVVNNF